LDCRVLQGSVATHCGGVEIFVVYHREFSNESIGESIL